MKFRTTRKEIMEGFENVIQIGYCNAQFLLGCVAPVAYTCGRDGWNSDVYDLSAVSDDFFGWAVSTGYKPFGNVKVKFDTVHSYEKAAEEIRYNTSDYWTRKKLLTDLLKSFIQSVKIENGLAKIDN